jgi:hypothetical protein
MGLKTLNDLLHIRTCPMINKESEYRTTCICRDYPGVMRRYVEGGGGITQNESNNRAGKNKPENQRNAVIFDEWWVGQSVSTLARAFDLSYSTINKIIIREIMHRGLPLHSITRKVRREVGHVTKPPYSRGEIRKIVLQAYGLED